MRVSEEKELHFLKAFPGRTGSGYVVDWFWSAWDAFAEGDSYRNVIQRAIGYGDVIERIENELRLQVVGHCPEDDLAGEDIDDRG